MTIRTLLTTFFIIFLKSNMLLAQTKSISEWNGWTDSWTLPQFMDKAFQQNKLGLTAKDDLSIVTNYTDPQGVQHLRLQQFHDNILVENAVYLIHQHPTKGTSTNGVLIQNLDLKTTTEVSETQALTTALSNFKANKYAWEVQTVEALLQKIERDDRATYYPKAEVVITSVTLHRHAAAYRLAYRFDIYSVSPMERYYVYIDAHTGQFIKKTSRLYDINHHNCSDDSPILGNGETRFYGNKTFEVTNNAGIWEMQNHASQMLHGNYGNQTNGFTNIINTSNTWLDTTANTAYWAIQRTHDYFLNQHNRNGYDDAGTPIPTVVHFGQQVQNAFWTGNHLIFGDGDAIPHVAADIVAHEWTHALIENTANLTYQGESGAINEALCDIFGVIIEDHIATNDWIIASENGGIRNLANPNAFNHPDTYLGTHWYSGIGDYGGVHTNSGVLNYWFYLLTQGGNGVNDLGFSYNVNGIGINDAASIIYKTLTNYLTPTSQYRDIRIASLQATEDLFLANSTQHQAVADAWCAVGVGGADAAFTYTNIQPSLTVDFTPNIIDNSLTYAWDFGDGNTSTLPIPTHTYTTDSVYDVRLMVNDACGGTDTTEQALAVTTNTSCIAKDSLMLVRLYYATDGPNWTNSWDLTQPISTWYGITKTTCAITKLNRDQNNPIGTIPNLSLPNLQELDLSVSGFPDVPGSGFNGFVAGLTGKIPNLDLPSLEKLNLSHNQFTGNIPDFKLPKLKQLYLSRNQLTGSIPSFDLPLLEQLYLGQNQLTGSIPSFDLPNLTHLYLYWNQLTGNIPDFNLPSIKHLWLEHNQLIGNIPDFNLPNLISLTLEDNQLTGVIPNFNNLPNLTNLYLYDNQLTGDIPNFNLPNLINLKLYNNQLTGNIPNFNLPNLIQLSLHYNQLTGNIPNFNKLISLRDLDIENNQLIGDIPNFNNLPSLIYLSIDNNQLTGSIPNFNNLTNLQLLDLSYNQLTGNIPNFNLPSLSYLYLEDNRLNFDNLNPTNFGLISYGYSPQDSIVTYQSNNLLYTKAGGNIADNTYNWYKNNTLDSSIIGDSTYLVQSSGHYRCEVSNSIFTRPNEPDQNLILYSQSYYFDNCLTGDSTALIQLANTTNGQYWTTPWDTTQLISTWQGVYLNSNGCGIDSLDIHHQNIQGTIPNLSLYSLKKLQADNNQIAGLADFQYLDSLTYFSIANNQLANLPNSNHLPRVDTLYVQHNQLTFEDLVPYVGINDFQYAPQDSFELDQFSDQLIADVGDATNCTFYWYKDGIAIDTIVGDSSYTLATTGNYHVEVTHNTLTQLTLWSAVFSVNEFCTITFTSSQTVICEGTTVNFLNSNTPDSSKWYLNGQLLTETQSAGYTFSTEGVYIIKLVAYFGNCIAIHQDTIIVHPHATIDLATNDKSICTNTFSETLTAREGMATYQWEFGGQTISDTSTCTATQHGLYTLTATDQCGNSHTETTNLFIGDDCYVWAGDCNNDGIVNGEDWLAWGLMFGDTGTVRNNATTTWQGEICPNWNNQVNGINSKHADTNGDGIVNFADTVAIVANFDSTKSIYQPNDYISDYKWDYSPIQFESKMKSFERLSNDTLKIVYRIFAKNKGNAPNRLQLHGANLDIKISLPPYINYLNTDIDFSSSSMGVENQNMYSLRVNKINQERSRIAVTRTDINNNKRGGEIAEYSIVVVVPVDGNDTLKCHFDINQGHISSKFGIHDGLLSQEGGNIPPARPFYNELTIINGANANFPVETQATPTSCSEGGTASANPIDSFPPYTYLWSTGDTSQTITDLDTGSYSILVTNGLGKTGFGLIEIDGINHLQVDDLVTSASNGQANGAIELDITGGSGYYSILWNNEDTTYQRSNLAAGRYIVKKITDDSLGCALTHRVTVGEEGVPIQLKVMLEGAYDATTLLMYDSLRTHQLLPLDEPFQALGFNRLNIEGEQVDSTIFKEALLKHDNIVDWILVELRDKDYPQIVLHSRAALLQRDGDIVDIDGQSPLAFDNIIHQSYYIAIQHRNHLGIMTDTTYILDETGLALDFTNGTVPTYGIAAQKIIGNQHLLYSGDGNKDGQINAVDKNLFWEMENGDSYHYLQTLTDFNLDGQINAVDKNLFWTPNNSKQSQIPE